MEQLLLALVECNKLNKRSYSFDEFSNDQAKEHTTYVELVIDNPMHRVTPVQMLKSFCCSLGTCIAEEPVALMIISEVEAMLKKKRRRHLHL